MLKENKEQTSVAVDIASRFRSFINFNYNFLRAEFGNRPFKLLDVGSGNHSASKIKRVFPNCQYHGLDLDMSYNYDEHDKRNMHAFYEVDLNSLQYDEVPDDYFDAIWLVHVIEHLPEGEKVLSSLLGKLKTGGILYVEYPGEKSTKLPSMYGTLNFYDDPTHVRIYGHKQLCRYLVEKNCRILRAGTRRNLYYIAATPFRVLHSFVTRKRLQGNLFWDITGFAEFVLARKI